MDKYKARPLSRSQIRGIAHRLREILGIKNKAYVDVIKLLEHILPMIYDDFCYEYVEDDAIDVMAVTAPNEGKILIRNSVYIGAVNDNGRDRFTIMHEIAHFLLHRGMTVKLARGNEKVRTYEDPEWQADAFAGEFLMDSDVVSSWTIDKIAEECKVSFSAARCQYNKYQKLNKDRT